MSHYNWRAILTQSPETLKIAVLAVAGVIAASLGADPTLFETLGFGLAIERVLHLFYTAPVQKRNEEAKVLEGIDLGRKLEQPVRPLRARPGESVGS